MGSKFSQELQVEALRGSSIAARLLNSGLNINSLRTNGILRKDEWLELDARTVEIARARLVGIEDLRSRNLVRPLGGLGVLISQYEAISDMTEADVSMAGVKAGEEDDVEFNLRSVPVPIVHKDFRVNIRRLEASRRNGEPIDATQAQVASRRVSDKLEDILFNGSRLVVDGNSIYGYTTHPQRNVGTATGSWATITNIYDTVLEMVQQARDDHYNGPWVLYVSVDQWTNLMKIYNDGTGDTALKRLLNIPGLEAVKFSEALADNTAVLVTMVADVVDLAVAQDITNVEWESLGGMMSHYKVMACMVPRIKYDYDNRSGIVHYTALDGSGSGS